MAATGNCTAKSLDLAGGCGLQWKPHQTLATLIPRAPTNMHLGGLEVKAVEDIKAHEPRGCEVQATYYSLDVIPPNDSHSWQQDTLHSALPPCQPHRPLAALA